MNATSAKYSNILSFTISQERRATPRFPMLQDLTYQYRDGKATKAGAGTCVNIGSGGVLFSTTWRLPIGKTVEVSINWPALLDGSCPLKFVASGPVVRVEDGLAAIRIDKYEFRTRGARSGLAAALSAVRGPAGPIDIRPR